MRWNWCFWQRETVSVLESRERPVAAAEPERPEEWKTRLIEAGVAEEWASQFAERLRKRHLDLGQGSAVALIAGVAIAVEVQAGARAHVERNMRDVREVERLLGAFSGELEKLDEVLEVLSAYAQRMRSSPTKKASRRVLH